MQTYIAALLRMELTGKYISLFNRCMDMRAVFSRCFHDFFLFCLQIIGMPVHFRLPMPLRYGRDYLGIFLDSPEESSVML